ncbi:hypothetical protein HELRODRAFT_180412 [Helobdella robusta]|uniref:Neurotransmitter-gated ion-channel ligand-binding domain-containing protein n=1 Tax=Helobdella robusta TaxID=6412 RepID=T1FFW5_HELRO|nr:hypothetical protein HELRODRAFT_180412 [Helobdella robusta]ESN93992.1 hypothetical protein HELRODRAFT_180412 [Helobdella robusta]
MYLKKKSKFLDGELSDIEDLNLERFFHAADVGNVQRRGSRENKTVPVVMRVLIIAYGVGGYCSCMERPSAVLSSGGSRAANAPSVGSSICIKSPDMTSNQNLCQSPIIDSRFLKNDLENIFEFEEENGQKKHFEEDCKAIEDVGRIKVNVFEAIAHYPDRIRQSSRIAATIRIHVQVSQSNLVILNVSKIRVSDIDLMKEQFISDIFMQNGVHWNPELFIENIINVSCEVSRTMSEANESGENIVVKEMHISGTFYQAMEWTYFPFDTQLLTFSIMSRHSPEDLNLVVTSEEDSRPVINDPINNEIFHFGTFIKHDIIYDDETKHLGFQVQIMARRKTKFFIINFFVFMYLLTSVQIVTLFETFEIYIKLNLSLMILCITIFYKYAIRVFSLPTKYLFTSMDTYYLANVMLQVFVIMYHGLINMSNNINRLNVLNIWSHKSDNYVFLAAVSAHLVINIIFYVFIITRQYSIMTTPFFGY